MNLNGVHTALVTPFNSTGVVDEKALRQIVEFQIEQGVSGLVPVGTTGESPTLSHQEHHRVVEIVVDSAAGRVPVIAGTGSNSTDEAIALTSHAKAIGANYTLQVAPYYNKPNHDGMVGHFKAIADQVDLPMIVYNIPGRTSKNIETATMIELSEHPNIVGVKEASGELSQMMDVIAGTPDDFVVLSGDDNLGLPLIAAGGTGIISVASNVVPGLMKELVAALLNGDYEVGRRLHYRLLPLFQGMFLETNPIPVKYALARMGVIVESYRLPLAPLSPTNKGLLDRVLQELGLI